jgi:hypothetical protein
MPLTAFFLPVDSRQIDIQTPTPKKVRYLPCLFSANNTRQPALSKISIGLWLTLPGI